MNGYLSDIASTEVEGTPQDRSMQRYWSARSLPETLWELGFLRKETPIKLNLYNGGTTDLTFIGVKYTTAEGITLVSPTKLELPVVVSPRTGIWLDVLVSLEGPTKFDSYLTFVTDIGEMILHITGIRVPVLSGAIATLLWPHNWVNGYTEILEWRTKVLTSYDGTEQRIGLLPLPRRSYKLEYLVEGSDIELLGTYLSARRTDFFYIPTWHDVGFTNDIIHKGANTVPVDPSYRDYEQDQKLIIWKSREEYDQISIFGVDAYEVSLVDAVTRDYPAGTLVAPSRPYYLDGEVKITNYADTIVKFECTMSSVYDNSLEGTYATDIYLGFETFPVDVNYTVSTSSVKHKWEVLDNSINLPIVVRESIEPTTVVPVEVLTASRRETRSFYEFLYGKRGQAIPFWMESKSASLYVIDDLVMDDNRIVIRYCGYTVHSLGERGKTYINISYKDGTEARYRIIGSEANPIMPDRETLQVDAPFLSNVQASEIVCIKYMQLVRFESDRFEIKWEVEGIIRCKFNIRILV